jgi:hypothetical protein
MTARQTGRRWLPAGLMALGSLGVVATLAVALGRSTARTERESGASSPSWGNAAQPSTNVAGHDAAKVEARVRQRLAERPLAPAAPDGARRAVQGPSGAERADDRDLALSVEERRQLTDESDSPAPSRALSPEEQARLTEGEGPDVPPQAQEPPDPATLVDDDQPAPHRVLSAEEQRRLRDDAAP